MAPYDTSRNQFYSRSISSEIASGFVVFLVALPLCLGIALASGAPLFSGIISGIVGGIVVSLLSGSALSVSGPAAGLAVIVLEAIRGSSSFAAFSTAVLLAGVLQIFFGIFRCGGLGDFVPISVIQGMLAAIGIIIFLKQIPHALGWNQDFEGDETFFQFLDGENTFSEITKALSFFSPTSILIFVVSAATILFWERKISGRGYLLSKIPGPLIAVLVATALNEILSLYPILPALTAASGSLVKLPTARSFQEFFSFFSLPDLKALADTRTYTVALTLAVIASIETLLSIEATDKLDPLRRISDTNRELKAQGLGNILCGILGGLPLTSVIVRSSANIYAGATTKWSAFAHGVFLLVCVALIPWLLNTIPLASLAAILMIIGAKLASPKTFKMMLRRGPANFAAFIVTCLTVVFVDMLVGVASGLLVSLVMVLRSNYYRAMHISHQDHEYIIEVYKDLFFMHRAELKEKLLSVPAGSKVIIDGNDAHYIDEDILDVISDFRQSCHLNNIILEFRNFARFIAALDEPHRAIGGH